MNHALCHVCFLGRVNWKLDSVTCITVIEFVAYQEESWAVTAIKEEQIDEITKEEQEFCFEV
jgi:hypothetical protein